MVITIRISIHASTWEATDGSWLYELALQYFNSRLYMRGNTVWEWMWRSSTNFNSRLYMRGNGESVKALKAFIISIHASTWEATATGTGTGVTRKISIHASTWEATTNRTDYFFYFLFQFTPLHERQLVADSYDYWNFVISIHASTWEATFR